MRPYQNGVRLYRQTQVTTASPAQLVVQLYEHASYSILRAIQAMEKADLEQAHAALLQAQAIITELRSGLRREVGAIAIELDAVYDYFFRQLVQANVRKDPVLAAEVLDLLGELLTAWKTIANPPGASGAAFATATGARTFGPGS